MRACRAYLDVPQSLSTPVVCRLRWILWAKFLPRSLFQPYITIATYSDGVRVLPRGAGGDRGSEPPAPPPPPLMRYADITRRGKGSPAAPSVLPPLGLLLTDLYIFLRLFLYSPDVQMERCDTGCRTRGALQIPACLSNLLESWGNFASTAPIRRPAAFQFSCECSRRLAWGINPEWPAGPTQPHLPTTTTNTGFPSRLQLACLLFPTFLVLVIMLTSAPQLLAHTPSLFSLLHALPPARKRTLPSSPPRPRPLPAQTAPHTPPVPHPPN